MKKHIYLVLGIILLALLIFAVKAKANNKVTICHATSSETNPYVKITVDEHATGAHFDEHGTPLAGHEEDLLLQGDVDCPVPPTPYATPTTPYATPETPYATPEPYPTPYGTPSDYTTPSSGSHGGHGGGSSYATPSTPDFVGLQMPSVPTTLPVSDEPLPRTGQNTSVLLALLAVSAILSVPLLKKHST